MNTYTTSRLTDVSNKVDGINKLEIAKTLNKFLDLECVNSKFLKNLNNMKFLENLDNFPFELGHAQAILQGGVCTTRTVRTNFS